MEFERIRQITADVLCVEADDIMPDSEFARDLGADSLELCRIMCRLEDDFDMELTYDIMSRLTTVKAVADYIRTGEI